VKTILSSRRASALVTVVIFCGVLALLATSMMRYSVGERRGNERNRLILRAKNQAENITVYAADQLSAKLYRMGSAPKMKFTWSGTGSKRLYLPPDSVLTSSYSTPANVEMRAGIEAASDYALVTDTTDVNAGLQVSKARVPIIAKASATHPALGTVTSYVEQDMEMALTPLFQFGMFYNMDLELYPSVEMTISGPVHSNKRIMAKPNATANIALRFTHRVSCAQGIYAEAVLKSYTRDGEGDVTAPTTGSPNSTETGNVFFTPAAGGAAVDMKNSSNKWRDHKYTQTTETTTTVNDFKGWAKNTYGTNLRTSAHGVTALQLPGIGTYQETDDPVTTDKDERNNGRQIIEPPNPQKYDGTNWNDTIDDSDEIASKISYKAGLYIMVNPDYHTTPRKGTLPNGSVVWVTPNSYRAWLNATDGDGNRSCTEVVLPGQPSYGYSNGPDGTVGTADDFQYRNYLPNRYTELTIGGPGTGNQLLRIPQAGNNMGSGYLVNGAHGTVGATTIAVDTGTGPIRAGEIIRVGTTHRYMVAEDYAGGAGNLKIMDPGILATITDNTAITVEQYGLTVSAPSPAYNTYKASSNYPIGTTKIDLRLGSSGTGGTFVPGNAITIGIYKYLVTAAPIASGITSGNYSTTSYTIGVAPLRVATNSGVAVTTADLTTPFNLGTGLGYRVNGAVSAGSKIIATDTGSGTILPGDTVFVGGKRYLVTTTDTGSTTLQVHPAAAAAIADDSVVIVDPYKKSGYSRSTVYPVANTGIAFPADNTAPYGPADAYFFDMRRANANSGHTGYATAGDPTKQARYDRNSVAYAPRACAKVDFDMTRFRMLVDRVMNSALTSSIYDVRAPSVSGTVWNNSIFNKDATRASFGLGTGSGSTFTTLPATTNSDTKIRLDPYNLYYAPEAPEGSDLATVVDAPMDKLVPISALFNDLAPDAWYDGLSVYVHSMDAEKRKQTSGVPDRVDSGVRLWNGRGPVISLSTATKTGFTFVTNDAVYIVGHFNADGTIDSSTTDTGTGSPNYYGGYSGTYPDGSEEKLCAVMGDAFTALSQPTWTSSSGGQTGGWNDARSALSHSNNYSGWRSTSSTTGALTGSYDGLYLTTSIYPGLLPNQSYSGSIGTQGTSKLTAVVTEMSTALLMGLVPSNHNPTGLTDGYVLGSYLSSGLSPAKTGNGVNSGGANNFPRLLENWSTANALYIRGSIVGLYESRVAMEPFTNGRCYNAPGRYWGLHYNFSQAKHDVPLEPIVIGSNRVGFRELTKAEYTTKKSTIENLP
jgi:hypothetical protein